ncbi:hypothetical protein [Salinicola halimionae]|nr:hypothetical protein [Salinicola halimionae]
MDIWTGLPDYRQTRFVSPGSNVQLVNSTGDASGGSSSAYQ